MGDGLQTFKNIKSPTRGNLGDFLRVVFKKYVEPQSMGKAEHKSQKLIFNASNQKLLDFRDELQGLAEDAFRMIGHFISENFIYDKMPHLK